MRDKQLYMIIIKNDNSIAARNYDHPLNARLLFCQQRNISTKEFDKNYRVVLQPTEVQS